MQRFQDVIRIIHSVCFAGCQFAAEMFVSTAHQLRTTPLADEV
jgi:hypothetical protein